VPPGTLPDGALADDLLPDGASRDTGAGSAAYTRAVTIIVEPSDRAQALISAIQTAKVSVHMTMYLLSNSGVINALISQKNMGHDVKVVLNQNFPQGAGGNSSSYATLRNAGVSVVYAPSGYTYTHAKCVIIDNSTAWIMTMNAAQSSPTDNREYLAVDSDPDDVQTAEAVFQADFANLAMNNPGKLVVAPVNARDRLLALLGGATNSIDLEGEELSDSEVVGALASRADAGVNVRVVLGGPGSPAQQQAIVTLKQHGIPIKVVTTPYMHAKAIVVDGARAYVGSENFTTGSLVSNREVGVIFDVVSEVGKVATTIASDFAGGRAL